MDEKLDVIIVGGGLSGLSAAYALAEAGKEVLVVERGDYCGAKNVTGGRIYISPVWDMFPDLWKKAPFERAVVHEEICVVSEESSLLMRYSDEADLEKPCQSYTVLRAKFDKYFAKQAERKGAMFVTKTKVENLIIEDNKVIGVVAGEESLYANIVILCDGAMSLLAEKAGLRRPGKPSEFAVGIKEVIELDSETINDRFNVKSGQGSARLYMGDITKGKFGGGFLYVNNESVSIGLVLGIKDLMDKDPFLTAPELLDLFKARPEVAALIEGGQTVEYAAHVVPEGGYQAIAELAGEGVLVCGDAAGLSLNAGITVRGMEYAIGSGYFAAQAAIKALEKEDYSKESLSVYREMLEESFVLKDLKTHQGVPAALENERLFAYYPKFVNELFSKLYDVPNGPKERIMPTVKKEITFKFIRDAITKDWGSIKKL